MNRQINSFQNMEDVLKAKVDRLARKSNFVHKKNENNGQFVGYANFGG